MLKYRTKLVSFVLICFTIVFTSQLSYSQISKGGLPQSFKKDLGQQISKIETPSIDTEALLVEDSIEQEMGLPFRFGKPFEVKYSMENSGDWQFLPDGSKVWRLRIECPGAYSINLIYSSFWLPEGSEFFVYNPDRTSILGAFTSQNNKDHGKFSTGLVKGDVTIIEYYEPAIVEAPGEIEVGTIVHGYKNLFDRSTFNKIYGYGDSGPCNINANCPSGDSWQDEKRAVAMILTQGGSRICSGALVNNARQDLTPYFLTANHCLGGESTWVFMFNYESPGCNNEDGPTDMTVSGCTRRANTIYSDFALLELSSEPPESYNVHYAGWTRTSTPATSAVGIHHPSGDIKKISFQDDELEASGYLQPTGGNESHWKVDEWELGTTESGSSGSPLFNQDHLIVGQLHGGYASCSNSDQPDWYGRFDISWDYGTGSTNRLKDWLDPDNTGLMSIEGIDAYRVKITHVPMEDTKNYQDDYEVVCNIIATAPLVADSLLLYYMVDDVWEQDTLIATGSANEFNGFIPAQTPGTYIDYYLYAQSEIGDFVTTDTYSFRVIDYNLSVEPENQTGYGLEGSDAEYIITITNEGLYEDSYTLAVDNTVWTAKFFDETGMNEINSTASIQPDNSADIIVKVSIPPGTPIQTENITDISIASQAKPEFNQSAVLLTYSAGNPAMIPWDDEFPDDTIYSERWFRFNNTEISEEAINEPSMPYSIKLDNQPDTLITQPLDLSAVENAVLSFYYEKGGEADPPTIGNDLYVEYRNQNADWNLLDVFYGDSSSENKFTLVSYEIPSDAYYQAFQVRFRTSETGNGGNWFLDNIQIGLAPVVAVSPTSVNYNIIRGDVIDFEITIDNSGQGDLIYDIEIVPHINYNPDVSKDRNPASYDHPDWINDFVPAKGEEINYDGPEIVYNSGGPDNFGYIWIDSDDPNGPAYDWIDISSTGNDAVSLLSDDSFAGPFDIGFSFPFYNLSYTQLYVGSNGIVGFESDGMSSRSNKPIPTSITPNTMLALFWDDMDPENENNTDVHVYYQNLGDIFVISFENYPEFDASAGDVISAQIILFENGDIKFQYKSIGEGFNASALTVGIEDKYGLDGLEVAFLSDYLHDNLAVYFSKSYNWLELDKTTDIIAPSTTDIINCQILCPEGVPAGIHRADLGIRSNDPDQSPFTIPIEVEIYEEEWYLCGNVNGDDILDISDAVFMINYVFVPDAPEPYPEIAANVNCDEVIDISDAVFLINYVFVPDSPEPCDCP